MSEARWLADTRDLADQDFASGHLTEFWRARVEALLELLEAAVRVAAGAGDPQELRCGHCERPMRLIWACTGGADQSDNHPLVWRTADAEANARGRAPAPDTEPPKTHMELHREFAQRRADDLKAKRAGDRPSCTCGADSEMLLSAAKAKHGSYCALAGDRPPAPSEAKAAHLEADRLTGWLRRIVTAAGDVAYLRDLAYMALNGRDPYAAEDVQRAVRPTPRAAPTLKETLREMYEQEFYQAGDKDYEVWLDRVVAWLAPRLASPVSLGVPTPAMIEAAQAVAQAAETYVRAPIQSPERRAAHEALARALVPWRAALTAQEQK